MRTNAPWSCWIGHCWSFCSVCGKWTYYLAHLYLIFTAGCFQYLLFFIRIITIIRLALSKQNYIWEVPAVWGLTETQFFFSSLPEQKCCQLHIFFFFFLMCKFLSSASSRARLLSNSHLSPAEICTDQFYWGSYSAPRTTLRPTRLAMRSDASDGRHP